MLSSRQITSPIYSMHISGFSRLGGQPRGKGVRFSMPFGNSEAMGENYTFTGVQLNPGSGSRAANQTLGIVPSCIHQFAFAVQLHRHVSIPCYPCRETDVCTYVYVYVPTAAISRCLLFRAHRPLLASRPSCAINDFQLPLSPLTIWCSLLSIFTSELCHIFFWI